jgi:hypothetical protein
MNHFGIVPEAQDAIAPAFWMSFLGIDSGKAQAPGGPMVAASKSTKRKTRSLCLAPMN